MVAHALPERFDLGPSSGLDPRVVAVLNCCFERLRGRDSNIDVSDVRARLALDNEYLAQRILDVLDANGDGVVDCEEFMSSVRSLLLGSATDRLLFAFRIHDLDEDSLLDRRELQHMIELGLREDSLLDSLTEESRRLADLVLAEADTNRDARVSFAEFEAAVRKHAPVFEQLTNRGLIWLAPDEHVRDQLTSLSDGLAAPTLRERWRARSVELVRKLDNRAITVVLLLSWGLANAVLFERAMVEYAQAGAPLAIQIARGAGACLKLNIALVLLPMLRLTLTWMRRTPVLRALPIDDATAVHRFLGKALVLFALLHTAAHLTRASAPDRSGLLSALTAIPFGATGSALLVIALIMWLCALPRMRGRFFELFHFTHLLYLAFFALLIVHAPALWRWAALPAALFAVDRGLRIVRRTRMTSLADARALPSGVTRLELARPAGFTHRPTDYVFVRIPEIAPHEWHPFTISSAPERERLSLHIRKLGNWTRELHALIQSGRAPMLPPLAVELDGPYGAPCSHLFAARHVVLIGAGIGATPFASVLESIALGAQTDRDPDALHSVHFFWIDRNPRGFEWFRVLLARIEREHRCRHLDINIFMTGGRNDPASAIVSLARELAHENGHCDLVTGLRARTRMGHPDFMAELGAIANQHAGEPVSVFFCGPDGLARKVKAVCLQLGLEFSQEHF